ncbi:MAG TPA: GNAT family N-acetyltransferase [Longimicrobiales bacterium]|nr:GNAT family N-acetyltransferase [Longimicrobiales bacterium]
MGRRRAAAEGSAAAEQRASTLPTLRTARLVLRPCVPGDASDVRRLAGDPGVSDTTLNIPHPYEEGMAEAWIATHEPEWLARGHVTLAVTEPEVGLVGAIGLRVNAKHRRGELGYWIGVPYWGRGYATEAAAALVGFGFDALELNRIQARHMTRNPASGRVLEKIGMHFEGVQRGWMLAHGRFEDTAVWAILREDRDREAAP